MNKAMTFNMNESATNTGKGMTLNVGNNGMTLNVGSSGASLGNVLVQLPAMAAATADRCLQAVARYYSRTLERDIDTRQTLLLLQAQAAFLATVFVDSPVLVRLLCMAWLVASLLKCKKALA